MCIYTHGKTVSTEEIRKNIFSESRKYVILIISGLDLRDLFEDIVWICTFEIVCQRLILEFGQMDSVNARAR